MHGMIPREAKGLGADSMERPGCDLKAAARVPVEVQGRLHQAPAALPVAVCWEEQARRSDAAREGMLGPHVANGRHSTPRRELEAEAQPFREYWEKKAVSPMVQQRYG